MKPKNTLRTFLALAGSSLIAVSSASAQTNYFWDLNGATAGTGGTGTWNATDNFWRTVSDTGVLGTWNSGDTSIAIFGGTAGTVTLGAAITTGGLTFNTSGYTITGNTLTLAGGSTPIINATTGTSTISSIIAGTNGLQKNGGGSLVLSNASNSFTGSLNIENGRVLTTASTPLANQGVNSALGAGTAIVLGGSGTTGRLSIQRDGGISTNRTITLATGGTGEIQFGNISDTNFTITNADRPLTLSGQISGGGNFVKLGGAAVVLSGSNDYTGTTIVNEGQLRLSNANALPGGVGDTGGTSALTINGNGTINVGAAIGLTSSSGNFLRALGTGVDQFQITGGVSGFDANGSARQVIVNNDASFELQWGIPTFNPSEFLLGSHTSVAINAITLQNKIDLNGATRTIRNNSTSGVATLSGDIRTTSGTAGLTKTGAGTLVLSGANTYNGPTTISEGTLGISNASTFTNTSAISLALGSRLEVSVANANLSTLVTGGGVPVGSFLRYSSAQTAAGSANGPGTIFGTVELNVTNVNPDYTLDFGSGSTFQNLVTATYTSPITLSGNASLLSSNAVFTLNSGGITASSAGAKTLTLTGTNTGANTINSVIGNGSGTIAVAKTGAGSWTFAGANTYSGATTVSAGTLTLSGADGAIASSAVTIAGGTLTLSNTGAANNGNRLSDSSAFTMNGATFNFNNDGTDNAFSEGAGTLTLIGGSSTAAIQQAGASGTSTLTFAGLSRTAGVLNFSGAGLGTAVDPRSTITFTSAPALTNGIIGPWATVNGLGYATLSGNDLVLYDTYADVNRGTGGTKSISDGPTTDVRIIESGAAANITLGSATTTVRSILNSVSGGASANATIAIGAGETLRVDSINSVPTTTTTMAMTIGAVVNTGTVTSATAGGDLLLINSSTANNFANANNNMTVNSVIADNTSASSVTKDGAGVLRLTGTNTYSGGTFINAGVVAVKADANLGAAGTSVTFNGSGALSFGPHPAVSINLSVDLGTRDITVNNESIAGLYHNWANVTTTISGNITGDGGIAWGRDPVLTFGGGDGYQRISLLGTANTFTGPLTVGVGNENIGVSSYFRFNSLGNSSNPITLNKSTLPFEFNSGATADLALDRPIVLGDTSGTLRNNSAFALTYNGSLLTSGSNARTLILGGTGAGLSTYGGDIADGSGQQVAVTKQDSGTWTLSGNNSYSGNTTMSGDSGTLEFRGTQAVPTASKIVMNRNTTLRILTDDSGEVNLGNNIEFDRIDNSVSVIQNYTIHAGNNGGATTGSTIVLGNLDFTKNDMRPSRQLTTTGANGYSVRVGDVALATEIQGTATGGAQRFTPSSAALEIAGTIKQIDGNTGTQANANSLYLGGAMTGNLISGVIANADDYPSNPNAAPQSVYKGDAGEWILTGTNTYTGTTTISAGTLTIGGSGVLGGGNYAGNVSIASTSSGNLTVNSSANQTFSGVISGAGALNKNNSGTLILDNASNSLSGVTTVTGGTLLATQAAALSGYNAASKIVFNGGTVAARVGGAGWTTAQVDTLLTNATKTSGAIGIDTTNASLTQWTAFTTTNLGSSLGLAKLGSNTLILDQTNTYTGATTVSTGTLLVNGSISTSSLTTVASGATIGGSGTVGDLTVSSGGFINPGNSPGILNVSGDYTQAGLYTAEITGLTAGTEHDQINVTGSVDITGGSLTALFTAGTYAANDLIFILLNDGDDAITGTYSGFAQGATVIEYDGFDWKISYTANSTTNSFTGGNDIALMAIPEPKAALLGGLGLLLLLRRRREK